VPGAERLFTTYSKKASIARLQGFVDGYPTALLTSRLHRWEVKEELCVTIAISVLDKSNGNPVPKWLPQIFLGLPLDTLQRRLDYLKGRASKATMRETQGGMGMQIHPVLSTPLLLPPNRTRGHWMITLKRVTHQLRKQRSTPSLLSRCWS
jgi:hypothetical protein